jgi:hypothetical protein
MVASVPKWLAVHSPARRPPVACSGRAGGGSGRRYVDADRAGGRAQAATGAGVEAHVGVVLAEAAGRLAGTARRASSRTLTMRWRGLSVSRCEGHSGSQKPHSMQRSTMSSAAGIGLRFFEVGLRVVVEDDARVEQPCRGRTALDAPHQVGRLPCPIPSRRRAPCCGRCRARPSASRRTCDDQVAHVVHEAGVAVDLGRVAEILGEDEVQVAFQRVAEDDRLVVAVMAQQGLQVERRIGQPRRSGRRRPR